MPSQAEGAKELVERSRAGDQNATATIIKVRKNAAKGMPKAKTALAELHRYVKAHPVVPHGEFGTDLTVMGKTITVDKKKIAFTGIGGVLGYFVYGIPGAAALAVGGYLASKLRVVST